jgi:hypothetical protein
MLRVLRQLGNELRDRARLQRRQTELAGFCNQLRPDIPETQECAQRWLKAGL